MEATVRLGSLLLRYGLSQEFFLLDIGFSKFLRACIQVRRGINSKGYRAARFMDNKNMIKPQSGANIRLPAAEFQITSNVYIYRRGIRGIDTGFAPLTPTGATGYCPGTGSANKKCSR